MDLGERIKKYEAAFCPSLPSRFPILVRCDGRGFSSYTRGLSRNDPGIASAMELAALQLCKEIAGARIAYLQSDEISILINPWQNQDSQSWYDNNINKIVSISASIASAIMTAESVKIFGKTKLAYFDSRCFILPKEEINNYFIWREQDAIRNSVQIMGQMNFSHKELQNKNCEEIKSKLIEEKQINWEEQLIRFKRGACIIKETYTVPVNRFPKDGGILNTSSMRSRWIVDYNIPIFTEDRNYIENRI